MGIHVGTVKEILEKFPPKCSKLPSIVRPPFHQSRVLQVVQVFTTQCNSETFGGPPLCLIVRMAASLSPNYPNNLSSRITLQVCSRRHHTRCGNCFIRPRHSNVTWREYAETCALDLSARCHRQSTHSGRRWHSDTTTTMADSKGSPFTAYPDTLRGL